MKSELTFKLDLGHIRTPYSPLEELALRMWYNGNGAYTWIFRYSDIKKVETILGEKIEIPGFRDKFDNERVEVPMFKGKDFVEIREFPKIYQIVEHRKQEDGSIKELKHEIPKMLVSTIWDMVISHKALNKPIKTSTIAEQICEVLRIGRFHRQSGTFDFAKFFGSRKDYYTYFYLPMKVLVHKGYVKHHKSGKVERLI